MKIGNLFWNPLIRQSNHKSSEKWIFKTYIHFSLDLWLLYLIKGFQNKFPNFHQWFKDKLSSHKPFHMHYTRHRTNSTRTNSTRTNSTRTNSTRTNTRTNFCPCDKNCDCMTCFFRAEFLGWLSLNGLTQGKLNSDYGDITCVNYVYCSWCLYRFPR